MKEVYLYKKLKNRGIRCQTCAHYCVINDGRKGICRVRENQGGKLFALNYGKIIARHVDPIEKKPFYHFLPGTFTYSIAAVGCNFICKNCQNWDISQETRIHPHEKIVGEELTPLDIVMEAVKTGCPSIAYTYTEPTIFLEFALDCMKLAREKGLKNIWVSNGFMSKESRELILPYLDANNIDIKGWFSAAPRGRASPSFAGRDEFYSKNCGAKLQPVLDTLKFMKKNKVWIEITTLVIPTINDSAEIFEGIANFIKKELGEETPWHISRFFPEVSWKLRNIPATPVESLKKAEEIGKKAGLKNVYIGNI